MEKQKISEEVAIKEVNKWLDYKKVDDLKREENKDNIKELVHAICMGYLSLDKDFNFVQKLKFPIEADDKSIVASEFKYKPRLRMAEIDSKTANIKATNPFALIGAYISALTDTNSGIIKQMESSDYSVARGIAIFFL